MKVAELTFEIFNFEQKDIKDVSLVTTMTTQKTPQWLVPDYPDLGENVGEAAVKNQIIHYPKAVRTMTDPPILNQELGLISFNLFREPRKLRNGKPVYGFYKLRGNYAEKNLAYRQAKEIILKTDSKYKIRVSPVGHWLPITEDDSVVQEVVDITTGEERSLNDEAALEKRREQAQIARELQERQEELKTGGDIYDNPESLAYYTMKRVTEMKLYEHIGILQKQMDDVHEKLNKTRTELYGLDRRFPEYEDQWIDLYNLERKKVSIPPFNPSETMIQAYKNARPQ